MEATMASINFIWSDLNINEITSEFNFSRIEKGEFKKDLYCAKITPPLQIDGQEYNYLHFIGLRLKNSVLKFDIANFGCRSTRLNEKDTITIELCSPDLADVRIIDNIGASREHFSIFSHIFYKHEDSDAPEYLNTVKTNWSDLYTAIISVLKCKNIPSFEISVASPNDGNANINFFKLRNFLTDDNLEIYGKRVIFLIIKSKYTLSFRYLNREFFAENLSLDHQPLFYHLYRLNNAQTAPEVVRTLCKRSMALFLNGGVPIQLLDQLLEIGGPETEELRPLCNFQRSVIDFNRGIEALCAGDILNELDDPIFDLKSQILDNSNESTWRSLFWDRVIPKMFRSDSGLPDNIPAEYFLESELSTLKLFPDTPHRKIDYAAQIKFNNIKIPLLLIEYGAEGFSFESTHKDLMKMKMMSILFCHRLACELERNGKKAELARIYGLCVGGGNAQLIVAHPVITKIDDSEFDIRINLTSYAHWHMDILANDSVSSCTENCCKFTEVNPFDFESLIGPLSSVATEIVSRPVNITTETTAFQLDEPENVPTEPPQVGEVRVFSGEINENGLKRMKLFVILVKRRIALLNSDRSNSSDPKRNFKKIPDFPIPVSLRSTAAPTPSSNLLLEGPKTPGSPTANVKAVKAKAKSMLITKSSQNELMIIRTLAIYPVFFPKLYNVHIKRNGNIRYRFEKMIPLVTRSGKNKPMDASLVEALTFAIHCLHGLYILHDIVGVVHGDVSPGNILFSTLHNVWKLNDFDRSLPIEESEGIKRTAGTEGYTAPESFEMGLFTRKSDIFSLGRVLFDYFTMPFLVNFIEFEQYDSCKEIMNLFSKYEELNRAMTNPQPENRPSIVELLRGFYSILRRFKHNKTDSILLSVKSILATPTHKESKEMEIETIEESKEMELEPLKETREIEMELVSMEKVKEMERPGSSAKISTVPAEEKEPLIFKNIMQD